jgi:hypothetical protein
VNSQDWVLASQIRALFAFFAHFFEDFGQNLSLH